MAAKTVEEMLSDEQWVWRLATYNETVAKNKWIPDHIKKGIGENRKQQQFLLMSDIKEVFYGGAAGGGKSVCTLVSAAQYVHVPGYAALLLRENYGDLAKPGAWMDLSRQWWQDKTIGGEKAEYNERDKVWRFPSGATITFGYLDSDNAVYQYDSASFHFCAVDELTAHTEFRYRFMFGRLRRPKEGPLSEVPIRMRSASNPGNKGSAWVSKRFGCSKSTWEGRVRDTLYIPATLVDNAKNLDVDEYRSSLAMLDPLTRAQREKGDWDAIEGGRFKAEWFGRWRVDPALRDTMILTDGQGKEIERFQPEKCGRFQTCDPAASTSAAADYFVLSTWLVTPRSNVVWWHCHRNKHEIPEQVSNAQRLYRRFLPQFIAVEEVGNQNSLAQLLRCSHNPVMVVRKAGPGGKDKLAHAAGFIALAASGRVFLPEYPARDFPLDEMLSEIVRFTGNAKADGHDDVIDSGSMMADALPFVRNHTGGVPSRPFAAYNSTVIPLSGLR